MSNRGISKISSSKLWLLLAIFPLLFYPIGSLCFSMKEEHWIKSIAEYTSIVTNLIPHLSKLREYAIDVDLFDCILSLAVVSGFLFGVILTIALVPLIRKRIVEHPERSAINTRSYLLLLGFCALNVWFLWIDGPAKPEILPRLLRVVSKASTGIATYGVMYYFVSMLTPLFISMLAVITPTYLKSFQLRKL